MTDSVQTHPYFDGIDRLIRRLDRPSRFRSGCRRQPGAVPFGIMTALVVSSQILVALGRKHGLALSSAVAAGYGLLAFLVMWTCIRWADQWPWRWAAARTENALPGFAGLGILVLLLCVVAGVPLMLLVPTTGILWGLILFAYACLFFAHQRAGVDTRRLLEGAREASLRARLAPHFLFNTLNSLKAQIERDPGEAAATLDRLASLFRQVVETSDRTTVPLKEELAFVEAFLGIERVRMGDRLQVQVDVPEELEEVQVPPFSLQVLVENAVKHGVAPLEAGGLVRISARRDGAYLVLAVEDPGGGGGANGTGTALETLRQRLARPEDLDMGMSGGHTRVQIRWKA